MTEKLAAARAALEAAVAAYREAAAEVDNAADVEDFLPDEEAAEGGEDYWLDAAYEDRYDCGYEY
jgi:hypothetical protein